MKKLTKDVRYCGWKNRSTWNVSLWIANDYGMYESAVEFRKNYNGRKPYKDFIEYLGLNEESTPEGVKWLDRSLGYRELNWFMNELFK